MSIINQVKRLLPSSFRDKYRHSWYAQKRRILALSSVQKVKWRLNRPDLPLLECGSVNLHLGCGEINHPAFINIDLVPYPHIHYLREIDDLSIFADDSVDLIYASHCLEHFSYRKVPKVLAEWARVLKKGGIIRLSVPDFDSIVDVYQAEGRTMDPILKAIMGGQDYEYNYHYVVFNKDYLTRLMEQAGFLDVKEWIPGVSNLTTFDDWSIKDFTVGDMAIPISLNLEAIK